MSHSQTIVYHDADVSLEGYVAYPDNTDSKRPVILVVHDWSGKNELTCKRADMLATLGYIGFAIDMYGKGRVGTTQEEKMQLMQPLIADRAKLQQRILAAFETAKKIEFADPARIGAIGFCFGGLCVLDLARTGADVKAVASFHGLLTAPDNIHPQTIAAKILVLHGYDDPMVKADQLLAFSAEMTAAKADWQIDIYGHTMHAFTNPEANDPSFGTVYNHISAKRSFAALEYFFKETFG